MLSLLFLALVAVALYYLRRGFKTWSWKEKVVVITGASSGIGKEMALQLAAQGSKLILAARGQELNDVVSQCAQISRKAGFQGDRAVGVITDVTVEADNKRMVETAVNKFGRIDCLVLNAGRSMNIPFEKLTSTDEIQQMMAVNFYGPVYATQAALPHMKGLGDSRILVTSSVAGLVGAPGRCGYSASKFAVNGFFEALHLELEDKYGVSVTIVTPGFVKTNINERRLGEKGVNEIASGMPADECARISLEATARGQRYIVPNSGLQSFTSIVKVLAPNVAEYVIKKQTQRSFDRAVKSQ